MGVHRVQKGITGQAIDSASSCSRIANVGAAITADYVVPGIARMRWVIDSKLRVVEDVESFDAEFEIALAENVEVFQEGSIEIHAAGIVERIASAISKRQSARGHKG